MHEFTVSLHANSHIGGPGVHVCLAVTCHLNIWQNDRDLLDATAVTREWNGYRNKKTDMEKKIIPPILPRLEAETFRSRVRRSATELPLISEVTAVPFL